MRDFWINFGDFVDGNFSRWSTNHAKRVQRENIVVSGLLHRPELVANIFSRCDAPHMFVIRWDFGKYYKSN